MQGWPLEGHKAKAHSQSICKLTRRPFSSTREAQRTCCSAWNVKECPHQKHALPSWYLIYGSLKQNLGQKLRGGAKTPGWTSRPNYFIWKLSNLYSKEVLLVKFRSFSGIYWLNGWPSFLFSMIMYIVGWAMFQPKFHTPWKDSIHLESLISHNRILFFRLFF